MIRTARVYDPTSRRPPQADYRLLVMRLWPRGVRKDAVDEWQKEFAPSLPLLRAYRAGRLTWPEFARGYRAEMRRKKDLLDSVRKLSRRRTVTLLCGCEDESHCHRSLLKKIIESTQGAAPAWPPMKCEEGDHIGSPLRYGQQLVTCRAGSCARVAA